MPPADPGARPHFYRHRQGPMYLDSFRPGTWTFTAITKPPLKPSPGETFSFSVEFSIDNGKTSFAKFSNSQGNPQLQIYFAHDVRVCQIGWPPNRGIRAEFVPSARFFSRGYGGWGDKLPSG